jgi:outer membrane protein assembly factor BamD (BamD/ComL family)
VDLSKAGPASPRKGVPTAGPAALSIRAEIDLLDRARRALSGGAPDRALSLLNEYARRFPRGELRQEVEVVRIEALQARGEDDEAEAAKRRFEERFPNSAHRESVADPRPR